MGSAAFVPRKAEKKRVKLKMAVQGPSGSGKTWGALVLAKNLWPEAKICVVDTENESASLYADRFEFDTIPLGPPYSTARYIQCIDAAVKAGYDVLILDQISQQWDGEGGILRRKEAMDLRPGSNSFANWASFTPEHEAFKQVILQCPMHVIATLRTKQDYILVANEKGKQMPKKVGMAPIQRDGFDYEFTIVFEMQMDHRGVVSKDRTGLFNEKVVDLADPGTAESIRDWLAQGKVDEAPTTIPFPPTIPELIPPKTPEEVRASAQKRADETAATIKNPERADGLVKCFVKGVIPKETKAGRPYLNVTWQGFVGEFTYASCFHASLFDALKDATGYTAELRISEHKSADKKSIMYLNIEDVLSVNGRAYKEGKPDDLTTKLMQRDEPLVKLKRELKASLAAGVPDDTSLAAEEVPNDIPF